MTTGAVRSAYRILAGTTRNCAGGATPWNRWLSCEETSRGYVYEYERRAYEYRLTKDLESGTRAFVSGMRRIGWDVPSPEATFYVWMPCPTGYTSTELCGRLLDEADVVTTPGLGFGRTADGYIRAALTVETPRLIEAVERIGRLSL